MRSRRGRSDESDHYKRGLAITWTATSIFDAVFADDGRRGGRHFGIAVVDTEVLPDHGAGQRFDVQGDFAILKDAHRAGGLADGDSDGLGDFADRSRRPVP